VIDESVPRRFAQLLRDSGCDVINFPRAWKGLKNGALLGRLEAEGYACLLTSDRNIRHQQTIMGRRIGLIVLPAQRFEDLRPYRLMVVDALRTIAEGAVVEIPKRATSQQQSDS
jgi:hypothetical protein